MTYALIDAVITDFARSYGLHVLTSYKDEEVRSLNLVGPTGQQAQLWVDPPGPSDMVGVHAWDYRKRRLDRTVTPSDLRQALEDLRSVALTWVA